MLLRQCLVSGGSRSCSLSPQISSLLRNSTASSPLNFLIIHGTADATVHFQHSAELVKLLSALNVNYTLQHGLQQEPTLPAELGAHLLQALLQGEAGRRPADVQRV
ncbi:hypothetical protein F7725_001562 [Dissostichus mawsoni]|uniref:Peptidase S9 prolyl oligopeptidase catalytic domain-containing protein n=1 Tax=Dissostichus mawsoni TaxID=36200 RepID=A0A7J5Y0X6_DISMA|nr:hypothetical protein F7725_001562 [Dissostichus mawsoni]